MFQRALAATTGITLAGSLQLAAPAQAQDTVVQVQIQDCAACMIYAGTADYSYPYRNWSQTVRLRKGRGTLHIPTWVTSIQIGVQKGRWSGPGTQSQIVYQYVGETPGLPISYKRANTSLGGYMCIAPTPELVINARAVLRKTKPYKGWRKDPLFDKKEVLVWATPTLQGLSTYNRYQENSPLATERGLIGVQNTVCGQKYD